MTRIILGLVSLIFVSGLLFLTAETSVSSQSGRVNNSNWVVQITNAANATSNVNAKTVLPSGGNGEVPSALLEQMVRDGFSCHNDMDMEISAFASEYLKATRVDLNRDRIGEYVIAATDGPALCFGNSVGYSWIYRLSQGRWIALLNGEQIGIVTPAKTFTQGFVDLIIRSERLVTKYIHHYKFDGRRYRLLKTLHYEREGSNRPWVLQKD